MNTPFVRSQLNPRGLSSKLLLLLLFSSVAATAQTSSPASAVPADARADTAARTTTSVAMLTLPDSPGASSSGPVEVSSSSLNFVSSPLAAFAAAAQNVPPNTGSIARPTDKYIKPYQQVPRLTVGDKVKLGLKDSVSPLSAIGWLAAAGYSHGINGSPNYGTNGSAFAQRFGAAAARAGSEGIFSDSIMASVLHEDPRYYKMGSGHSFLKRTLYSITRPLITRTDGGHTTVNLAYLSGNLAGSFLTQAYYPPVNRGVSEVMQTYGGSIGGGALGFFVSEFLDNALQAVHLQKAK